MRHQCLCKRSSEQSYLGDKCVFFLSQEAHGTTFVYSIVMLIEQPDQPGEQRQHVGQCRLSPAVAAAAAVAH